MSIQEKLEEIKKQPEHIRMRYVVGCVVVSMIFVFVVWLVSLKQNFEHIKESPFIQNATNDNSFEDAVKELKNQKDSLMNNDSSSQSVSGVSK